MIALLIAFVLVALWWVHDIRWAPAKPYLLRLRQQRPKVAAFWQEAEELGKPIVAWLATAAGLHYAYEVLRGLCSVGFGW